MRAPRFRVRQTVVPLPARVSLLRGIVILTEWSRPPSHRLHEGLYHDWPASHFHALWCAQRRMQSLTKNCRGVYQQFLFWFTPSATERDSPLITHHLHSSPFHSYRCALFCIFVFAKLFEINCFRTLCQKKPGVGVPLPFKKCPKRILLKLGPPSQSPSG